jgi:phage terminase large subunit-like protein
MEYLWALYARPDQWPPESDWLIWLLLGGRGSGKTRAGAEWIRRKVSYGAGRIALVAPSFNDAREVMIEGESGLRHIGYPDERPQFISSRRRLEWPNGAVGQVFSSEDPDSLRGPQFEYAWADEFCAWSYPADTLSNLRMGLRLGPHPQLVVTTTPRPLPALKNLMKLRGLITSHMKTQDNDGFLAPGFIAAMEDSYGGTRLGRQELDGEFIEDLPGALWSRAMLESCRTEARSQYDRLIIALDPPVTGHKNSDACGMIVAGRVGQGREARAFILEDATLQGVSPESWAAMAVGLYQSWEADYILAETNQGGDLVKTVLHMIDPSVPVRTVFASRGKRLRAEPVAALYGQGRVHHIGSNFAALEDELCLIGTDNLRKSPDRADALVWAVTDLLLSKNSRPTIRGF